MYCPNCGKEVGENAVVCVNCGGPLNNYQVPGTKTSKGKGIASMVLGILAIYYCLSAFIGLAVAEEALQIYNTTETRIGFAIGFVLIQTVLSTIALVLALVDRKKTINGFNTSGLWLSIVSFAIIIIQFLLVINYSY